MVLQLPPVYSNHGYRNRSYHSIAHPLRTAQLPDFHKDPADRIIIATALIHDLPIVTGDGKFPQYGVKTIC